MPQSFHAIFLSSPSFYTKYSYPHKEYFFIFLKIHNFLSQISLYVQHNYLLPYKNSLHFIERRLMHLHQITSKEILYLKLEKYLLFHSIISSNQLPYFIIRKFKINKNICFFYLFCFLIKYRLFQYIYIEYLYIKQKNQFIYKYN